MNNSEKRHLIDRIREAQGLTDKEKTDLINFLNESKTYGLVWENKKEDIEEKLREELPVLVERNDEKIKPIISKDPNAPNNIIIEGDNLAALTDLSYTHAGKIDVIYIDPPYNTRNKDFKYNDNYVDPNDDYSHSTWLSFMSKRLKIAKHLLSPEGVIFIQIDDKEYAPLKLLCDSIFKELNSIGPIIQNKLNAKNDTLNIQKNHEYILCYRLKPNFGVKADGREVVLPTIVNRASKQREVYKEGNRFFYLNDSITTRGEGGTLNARPNLGYTFYYNPKSKELLPKMDYNLELAKISNDEKKIYKDDLELIAKGFIKIRPPKVRGKLGCWTWEINKSIKDIDNLYIKETKNRFNVHKRTFIDSELIQSFDNKYFYKEDILSNSKSILEYSTNEGTDIFTSIMGYDTGFNNPKNLHLIEYLISLFPNKNANILDFFAGTGTTLHATVSLNNLDKGKRTCILCTNNENNICEDVTYERNKRVINGYIKPNGEKIQGLKDNNLRYYKTEFISRELSSKNRRELMYKSTPLLNIKEDLYTEKLKFGRIKLNPQGARYFEDDKKKMLVIYRPEFIPYFVEEINKMEIEKPILVYVYSPGKYAFDDEFEIVTEKVQLCALPQAIIVAMSRVLPDKKEEELIPETEIKVTDGVEEINLFANLK